MCHLCFLLIFLGANNKSSHFHCVKCNFICSDTNKVVAHRRQHSKLEYIRMVGFRKVSSNEKCSDTIPDNLDMIAVAAAAASNDITANTNFTKTNNRIGGSEQLSTSSSAATTSTATNDQITIVGSECSYSMKQTHYHCLTCDCSVLSRAQLGSHRHRI